MLMAAGGLLGAPAVQMSLVHWLPSTGTSPFAAMEMVAPAPSHTSVWQLPPVWLPPGSAVPFGV
ncbi:MAG: hypothetical protein IPG81_01570 [Sandaracinaceae bacterium]|nr:hypothetical protein [Sandaracinaceae bacterium]